PLHAGRKHDSDRLDGGSGCGHVSDGAAQRSQRRAAAEGRMSEQPQVTKPSSAFRKGIMLTGSSSVVSLASLFLETLIAARLLTTDQFGTYVLLITIVNFLVVAADFGAKIAVTQMIASSEEGRQAALANSAVLFRLLVIAVVSAALWAGQGLLVLLDPSLAQYIIYIPLMLAAASFDELFLSMLQGFQLYQRMAAAQIVRGLLRLALSALLMIVFQLGVMGLIYSWTISFALSIAYQLLVLPTAKRLGWQRMLLTEMLRFGFPLYMTRFLWFALGRADVMLLAALAGPSSVAFYAVATRIPDALQRLAESYVQVFFPTMSSLLGRGKQSE